MGIAFTLKNQLLLQMPPEFYFCGGFFWFVFYFLNINKEPEITVQQCKVQYKISARNSTLIPPYTQIAKQKSKQVETQEIM